MSSNSRNEHGFTLIEVLISIVILAFISLGLYNAITQTYRVRDSLSTEGDFHNGIRLSMDIMQRDLSLLYSPIALLPSPVPSPSNPAMAAQVAQQQALQNQQLAAQDPDLFQVFDYWEPAVDQSGVRPSRFQGTENKISFVSNSHYRVYKDTAESEFADIKYELETDTENSTLQMLVKIENTDAFDTDPRNQKQYERRYILLHGIKSLKYRFYRKDKDEWSPDWDTDKDEFKGIYPDIIELKLLVTSGKLNFDGRFLFRPELPLRALNPSM